MFVLSKSDQYTWPVTVDSPKSGGTWDKMQFDAIFRRLKQSEIKALIEDPSKTDSDFARAVLAGWKGIQTEDKQDVPFSQDALEKLLDEPKLAGAISTAYLLSINGAPQKN